MNIQEHVESKNYTTFKVGGKFRYLADVASVTDLEEALEVAKTYIMPIMPLGGGSNIIFPDGTIDIFALHISFQGFKIVDDTPQYTTIKIGAGEEWDATVAKTVDMNLSGIEAMSAIPGTVGATPVQNVGAYGQEIKDTLLSVEVFDIAERKVKTLSNADCKFSYRDSIFKGIGKGKYIILSITLKLSKSTPSIPNYPGVSKYFIDMGITNPTLVEIREAIVSIRSIKLPDPKKIPNVGSFFKNPIVPRAVAEKLLEEYPAMINFHIGEDKTKIPAGWLMENAGLKGKNFGPISVYDKNALVLVNNGSATFADLMAVKEEIINTVQKKFSITLESEPEIFK